MNVEIKRKIKSFLKNLVVFLSFNLILIFALTGLNHLFRLKDIDGVQDRFKSYKESPQIVFVGSSHQYCSVSPDYLFDEYGVESFMLASSGQKLPMSYYAVMEAIELNKPEKVVVEMNFAYDDTPSAEGMNHYFLDGFPRCKTRKLLFEDLVDSKSNEFSLGFGKIEDRAKYLFPFFVFHSRWKEIKTSDFGDFQLSKRGGFYSDHVEVMDEFWEWECSNVSGVNNKQANEDSIESEEASEIGIDRNYEEFQMPEKTQEYVDKMADLCKDNGVELILYVAPYYPGDYEEDSLDYYYYCLSVYNGLEEYAQEKGITYLNTFYLLDEIGINPETDWMDRTHLNASGQEKMTRYLYGKILN